MDFADVLLETPRRPRVRCPTLYPSDASPAAVAGGRRALLANSLYHLTNDGAVTVMAGQITVLQAVFRFGPFEIGLLAGTALLVEAIVQVIVGAISDHRDPARFLPIGILLLGATSLLIAASSTFAMLLAITAFSRIGASFYHPVGIAWIGREFGGDALDRSMGFQSAFGDSGVILGMASGAVLGVALGWQSPFIVWGAINLFAAALGLWLVRSRPRLASVPSGTSRADYLGMLKDVRLWIFPLLLSGAAFNIFSNFGPPLLHEKFGLARDTSGVAIALWILAGTIATFFFGKLSRRFGRFRSLAVSYAFVGVAGLAGAVLGNVWAVLLGFWTLGATLFLIYPALFAFVSESSHHRLQGAAFGVIFGIQLLGGAAGLFAAGSLAEGLGVTTDLRATIPFYLMGLLSLAGFAYLIAARPRIENAKKPTPTVAPPL